MNFNATEFRKSKVIELIKKRLAPQLDSHSHQSKLSLLFSLLITFITLSSFLSTNYIRGKARLLIGAANESGSIQPADFINLLTWWVTALILISVVLIGFRPGSSQKLGNTESHLLTRPLELLAVMIVALSYTYSFDPFNTVNVRLFSPAVLIIGLILYVVSVTFIYKSWRISEATVKIIGRTAAVFTIPALWQAPNTIRDTFHFYFVSNELAATAVGKYAFSDFIPQYTALLGLPIVPFLRQFSNSPEAVLLLWVIFLQVFCIYIPILLIDRPSRRSITPLWIVLVIFPSIAMTGYGNINGINTYFQTFPIRFVGPMALVFALNWLLKKFDLSSGNIKKHSLLMNIRTTSFGIVCGLVVLNNLDFGLAAVLAAGVVIYLSLNRSQIKFHQIGLLFIGFFSVFIVYSLVGLAIGKPVNWENFFLFQKLFGTSGYGAVPMAPFGPHIGFFITFCAGCCVGTIGTLEAKNSTSSSNKNSVARVLLFVSIWALLSLVYFSGRSYSSTLWVGHIFQLSLVVFFGTIYVVEELRSKRWARDSVLRLGPILGALFVSGAMLASSTFRLPPISVTSKLLFESKREFPLLADYANRINAQSSYDANFPLKSREGQIFSMSNLIELRTGVKSLSIFNDTYYLYLSDVFMMKQCEVLEATTAQKIFYLETNENELTIVGLEDLLFEYCDGLSDKIFFVSP
jgi:hypothetical protein